MIQLALMAYAAKKLGSNRVMGIARTGVYATALLGVMGGIGVHKAHAAVAETGLRIGDDLAAVAPLLKGGSTINVNGQTVHFATSQTLNGTDAVLDKFQASCQSGDGANAPVWDSLPDFEDPKVAKAAASVDRMPVFRKSEGHEGFILCLIPSAQQGKIGFKSAVEQFFKNRTSLQLGKLRYATVHEGPTGSQVTTVWTDDNFDIAALVPDPNHDKPGTDPTIMLRPENSTRMLSGLVDTMPYRVFLYDSKESPKAAIDSYDAQMIAKGWAAVTAPQMAGTPHEGFEAHSYMRDGFVGYVTANTGPTGGTVIGVGETATTPMTKAASTVRDSDGF